MSLLGESRYGVAAAPGALSVVQELLNTAGTGNPRLPDLLDDGRVAGEWLSEVHSAPSGPASDRPVDSPSAYELRKLRALRASVASSVLRQAVVPVRASIKLELGSSGTVGCLAADEHVAALVSTVLFEIMLAQRSGEWERLKICGNPDCAVAFFDRSKSRTGVWHDVRVCGNAINLRASRSRRRAATGGTGSDGKTTDEANPASP